MGAKFLQTIMQGELLCNATTTLIHPEYNTGIAAVHQLQMGSILHSTHPNVNLWPSFFSGIQVIVNHDTPPHRDMGGSPTCYDFLLNSGTHKLSRLDLPDLGTSLSYGPGTLVAVSGKVLLHGVKWWEGGERVCIAHFIKDAVHARLGLERPQWRRQQTYLQMLGK